MNDIYNSRHQGFDWDSFIAGILFIVASFLLLRYPGRGLSAFVFVFGILSILQGIIWISAYVKFHNIFDLSWVTLISAIVDIVIGVLFLCSREIGGLTLAILFAIWFLADSIIGIIFSWHLREYSTGYFVLCLILNIVSLIIAFALLFNPVLAAITLVYLVAFWLMVFGINEIFVSWMHR